MLDSTGRAGHGDSPSHEEFGVLVLRYLDDAWDDEAVALLNRLLRESPELHLEFVRSCRRAAAIREVVLNRSERVFKLPLRDEEPEPENNHARQAGRRSPSELTEQRAGRWPIRLQAPRPKYAAAAAVLLCAAVVLAWLVLGGGEGYDWPDDAVAVLKAELGPGDGDLVFYNPGDTYAAGTGRPASLQMRDGATIVLNGGSQVQFETGDRVRLNWGSLVARADGASKGFTVLTPRSRVVDLGTEFGVEVGTDQAELVHLFEGRVDVYGPAGDPTRLSAGQARRVLADGTVEVFSEGRPDRFLRILPDSRFAAVALQMAPALYLPMNGPGEQPVPDRVLRHTTAFEHALPTDRIVDDGATSSSGRSLEMRNIDDPLQIDGAMQGVMDTGAYSIVLWVKPARLASQNLVTATSTRGTAFDIGPQVRLLPDGRIEHVSTGGGTVQRSSSRLRTGRWSLIVAVMDRGGTMRLYLDGTEAAPAQASGRALPGTHLALAIGGPAGQQVGLSHTFRGYDGQIDELFIYDRDLTAMQVAELYAAKD